MLYRLKPIEAVQWFKVGDVSCDCENTDQMLNPVVIGYEIDRDKCYYCDAAPSDHGLLINEILSVCPGDWIITDGRRFWACKPEVFARFYEEAPDA